MRRGLKRTWSVRDWMLILLSVGLAGWVMRYPLLDIIRIGWRDEEQSHIFLVPPIALWLLWLRRSRLPFVMVNPSLLGPTCVLFGMLISWWGFSSGIQVAWHAGALLCLVGSVVSMTGSELVRQFAPSFLILVFLIPVPGLIRHSIALPLQEVATTITHLVLDLFGVASTREGSILVINGEQVAVGEACNGMRMVFALTLVVYAFSFGMPIKGSTRAVLLILSPLMALVCNIIRLVPTSLFYGFATVENAQFFHDIAGWVMLPVGFVMLIGVLRMFNWLELPVSTFRLVQQ